MSLPELCVFDLDDCLWHPEMYTIHDIPSEAVLGVLSPGVQGVVGAKGGSTVVELFPAALKVLQGTLHKRHASHQCPLLHHYWRVTNLRYANKVTSVI